MKSSWQSLHPGIGSNLILLLSSEVHMYIETKSDNQRTALTHCDVPKSVAKYVFITETNRNWLFVTSVKLLWKKTCISLCIFLCTIKTYSILIFELFVTIWVVGGHMLRQALHFHRIGWVNMMVEFHYHVPAASSRQCGEVFIDFYWEFSMLVSILIIIRWL